MYNCWKSRRNLFYLSCCQYSDNKSMLIHEEGRFPSCYTLLSKNYSTGYFALTNFEAMRKQLGQQSFPVISGEGVHQVIMDIALSHPSKFPNLFPMLGIFRLAKVALHYAYLGKMLWKPHYRISATWRPLCAFLAWNTNHQGWLRNPEVESILGRILFEWMSDI